MGIRARILPSIPTGVIAFAAIALCFYSIGAWWGIPQGTSAEFVKSWGVDDESPLGPLTEIHNILHPKPNQWLSYPLLYSFITVAAYAPYMAYLLIVGKFSSPGAEYPFGFADPASALQTLTLIAHMVSAVMGALTVGATYYIGNALSGRLTAAFYATLTLVSFPLVYYARNGNVDATSLAFVALTVAVLARISMTELSTRRAVWLSIFGGLALAAKESAVGVFLPIPLLLIYWQYRAGLAGNRLTTTGAFVKLVLLCLVVSFLAFGLGSGLFVDPHRYFAHVHYLRKLLETVAAGETRVASTYPFTLAGNLGYATEMIRRTASAISFPGLMAALLGVYIAARSRTVAVVPAVLAVVYFTYLFLTYRLAQVRYLLPVIMLLLFYVPYAAAHAENAVLRVVALGLAALALVFGCLNAVDFTYRMLSDSRYAAAEWLQQKAVAGDTIAYFGTPENLPFLPRGTRAEIATPAMSMYEQPDISDTKVAEILEKWAADPPRFILLSPDHTQPYGIPYPHTVPPALYEGLVDGSFGYRQVAHLETPSLFPWLPAPILDYPVVNPPIRVFEPTTLGPDS